MWLFWQLESHLRLESEMEYYIIERENNDNYPLLDWVDGLSLAFFDRQFIKVNQPVQLQMGDPIPYAAEMVDYHELPNPVFSKKVKDALESLSIKGVQLVPATVHVGKEDFDYWILHVMNECGCLNIQESEYEVTSHGVIFALNKIVLRNDVFTNIPEEQRLIFYMSEYHPMCLYHQRVKDQIESVSPKGLKFISVEDWDDTMSFK